MTENHGWTNYGRRYHRVMWTGWLRVERRWAPCTMIPLDRTVYKRDGTPTGALVPDGLQPCQRCKPTEEPLRDGQ